MRESVEVLRIGVDYIFYKIDCFKYSLSIVKMSMSHGNSMSINLKKSVALSVPIPVERPPIVYEEEVKPLPTISVELKTAIQQARMAAKMSQKDLAAKMCVQTSVIHAYENGTAIPNNGFIAKIEKLLNAKLPRLKKDKEKVTKTK
jgi:ribosome-binding protein aMBF1 (putative translation factor)